MAGRLSFLCYALSLYARHVSGAAVTTNASAVAAYVFPPLTITGQFPCLTVNSYMIFTDSTSSSATYPIWTCTTSCGSLSSGVGLMVFPATTTTGAYEVQNPPTGYPALKISDLSVITETAFSKSTFVDVAGPSPSTTSTFTYSAFPGLALTVITTTPIPAVAAIPISVPTACQGGPSAGAGSSSGGSSAASGVSSASIPVVSGLTTAPAPGGASLASSQSSGGLRGAVFTSASSGATSGYTPPGGSNSGSAPATSASSGQSAGFNPLSASSGLSAISASSTPLAGSNPPSASSGQSAATNPASSNQPGASSGQSSGSSRVGQSPGSNSASVSASASGSQVLPPGASVVTSIVAGAGGSASASTVVETFIPTVISSLTTLTTALTTTSIVTYGTSSTSAIPITVFPGGTAWQIPSVGPGTPILLPPSVAPTVGTASSNPSSSGYSASSGLSGFTTLASSNPASSNSASPGGSAGYLGPVPLSAEPASITAALASQSSVNVIGLTTFSGTTTPSAVVYSSDVSSNGHTKSTGGVIALPLFWSHTCWFCPPGLCFFCGVSLKLPPGIYPPGSIKPPPGWRGPLPEITVGEDGTPYYSEEPDDHDQSNQPSSQPSTAQRSSNSPSQTSMTSTGSQSTASSQTSGSFQCAQTGCAVCVDNDPPSAYQPPTSKLKRSRLVEREEVPYDGNLSPPAKNLAIVADARSFTKDLVKRRLPEPGDPQWNGNQDLFLWTQYSDMTVVAGWVPLRQDANFPSSALAFGLGTNRFDVAVQGMFGCTSLIIISTAGVWMSHFWADPSFEVNGVINQANFQAHILNRLGPGDGTNQFPGLTQYLNNEFAADTKPVAIIMTPRFRVNPQPGVLQFQNQITQLSDQVQTIFGGTRGSTGQFTGGTLNGVPLIVDYTPKADQYSQQWTSSGKALFQYDPVQTRCNGVQWAMVRLWVEDRPLYSYQHYWVARAGQQVAPPANPSQAGNQKRQDPGESTPPPSCLASMTATSPVSMGAMSNSGSLPAASAASNSNAGSASAGSAGGLSSSPAIVSASTTANDGNAATSLAALSSASVAAVSAAQITQSPLCEPYSINAGGDGGVENCLPVALCQCSTGTFAGTYTTMLGSNQCGYSTIPSSQWNPNDQICTLGLSALNLRPTISTTTGQYIFTETDLPVSGDGTTVYGCTSTLTSEAGPVMGTYCAGSKTPLTTIFPPIKTPTGAPAAPSCNVPANPQNANAQSDTTGYVPDPVFFEAAIGVFCGPNCKGQSGCLSATGETLSSSMDAFKANFYCTDAQNNPGGNKSLDCEPNDWEHNPPPYWEASGIHLNLGIKLIDHTCQWTVDSDTCNKWLSNTLTGCPAAGLDWNECVAWTVGAGAAALTLSDWLSDHPKDTW